jgi:hypothetical protein
MSEQIYELVSHFDLLSLEDLPKILEWSPRTYLINNWRPVFGETGGAQASLQTRDGRPLGIDRRAVEIGGTFSTSGASGG